MGQQEIIDKLDRQVWSKDGEILALQRRLLESQQMVIQRESIILEFKVAEHSLAGSRYVEKISDEVAKEIPINTGEFAPPLDQYEESE